MDRIQNPFSPGAGTPPPELAGREGILEQARKPLECLEYIVVHEMAHLLEPTHNASFIALMDHVMPLWKQYRDQLNRLPVRHEEWMY